MAKDAKAGKTIWSTIDFLSTMKAIASGTVFFRFWKKRIINSEYYTQWKYSSGMKGEFRHSQMKEN